MSRTYMYEYKEKDEGFKKAWNEAVDISVEAMEHEARRRAVEGVEEPVFYQGDECGAIRKYSDTLLIFLLKAHKPEKYKERISQEITGKDGGAIEINDARCDFVSAISKINQSGNPTTGDNDPERQSS